MKPQLNNLISRKCNTLLDKAIVAAEIVIGKKIKDKLIEKIKNNFYKRWDNGDANWLTDSIAIKVSVSNNKIRVFVYFDNQNIAHTTWWGSDELGISSREKVYTPSWINDGWTFVKDGGGARIRDVGDVSFVEDAVRELEIERDWISDFYSYIRKIR